MLWGEGMLGEEKRGKECRRGGNGGVEEERGGGFWWRDGDKGGVEAKGSRDFFGDIEVMKGHP